MFIVWLIAFLFNSTLSSTRLFGKNKPKQPLPKFCTNCKYFLQGGKHDTGFIYGKCLRFPKKMNLSDETKYLVSGIFQISDMHHEYCIIARQSSNMCGLDGKYYTD